MQSSRNSCRFTYSLSPGFNYKFSRKLFQNFTIFLLLLTLFDPKTFYEYSQRYKNIVKQTQKPHPNPCYALACSPARVAVNRQEMNFRWDNGSRALVLWEITLSKLLDIIKFREKLFFLPLPMSHIVVRRCRQPHNFVFQFFLLWGTKNLIKSLL